MPELTVTISNTPPVPLSLIDFQAVSRLLRDVPQESLMDRLSTLRIFQPGPARERLSTMRIFESERGVRRYGSNYLFSLHRREPEFPVASLVTWKERISRAKSHGLGFTFEDKWRSAHWNTCACSELQGVPMTNQIPTDTTLYGLGVEFATAVHADNAEWAQSTLHVIQQRAAEVRAW